MKQLSLVIPVYRCGPILGPLFEQLQRSLEATGLDYEIIFVDDASTDESWQTLEAIRASAPSRITAVQLTANVGQHAALLCGLRHSSGELVVTMDADLQHPPEEVPTLIHAIAVQDLDAVYGRYRQKKHAPWRNVASRLIIYAFQKIFATKVRPTSFRILKRPLVNAICANRATDPLIDGIMALHTKRIGEIEVEHRPRFQGESSYSFAKLVKLAATLLFGYSRFLPRLVRGIGILMLILAPLLWTQYPVDAVSAARLSLALQVATCGLVVLLIGLALRNTLDRDYPLKSTAYVERIVLPAELSGTHNQLFDFQDSVEYRAPNRSHRMADRVQEPA